MSGNSRRARLCSVPLSQHGGCHALRQIHHRGVLRRRVLLGPSPCRIQSTTRSSTAGSRCPGGRQQEGSTRIPPHTTSYTLDHIGNHLLYPEGITSSPTGRPSAVAIHHSGSSP
ncbi:hypothetical protein E2562_021036 [Oryza meyeriana var. granulata]|uniref:Uncharacterized protein n=1 Tax=Oryza meyeriana var. granulata TaxID=110450 RepID=A0A6G1FAJ6_9ORYZ|nr:hypothetical protein E2562_021036 [Oryza meyeriana var. granulata]